MCRLAAALRLNSVADIGWWVANHKIWGWHPTSVGVLALGAQPPGPLPAWVGKAAVWRAAYERTKLIAKLHEGRARKQYAPKNEAVSIVTAKGEQSIQPPSGVLVSDRGGVQLLTRQWLHFPARRVPWPSEPEPPCARLQFSVQASFSRRELSRRPRRPYVRAG